jgi:hypothetical protein
MTPEAQRIAIAQACGWTYTKTIGSTTLANPPTPYGRMPKGTHPKMFGEEVEWDVPLPDYLSDLNVMHEVEGVLSEAQWADYTHWLKRLLTDDVNELVSAIASIRAEAFLRTLNLWTE